MKIPGKATISNRTSTIASQFARARAPYVSPSAEQLAARLRDFGCAIDDPACAYCGADASEWDHAEPMVSGAAWTGFFTEISNLVPACGKCNQSRGSKPFASRMRGKAKGTAAVRLARRAGLSRAALEMEIERRIAVIERLLRQSPPRRLKVEVDDLETELEERRLKINALLFEAEAIASRLRERYRATVTEM